MKNFFKKFIKEEKGQGMTEYGLILGLIALAVVGAMILFGDALETKFTEIKNSLLNSGTTTTTTNTGA